MRLELCVGTSPSRELRVAVGRVRRGADSLGALRGRVEGGQELAIATADYARSKPGMTEPAWQVRGWR